MMTTLQLYQLLVDTAADANRLAVMLRDEKMTKKEAEARFKEKIEEVKNRLK